MKKVLYVCVCDVSPCLPSLGTIHPQLRFCHVLPLISCRTIWMGLLSSRLHKSISFISICCMIPENTHAHTEQQQRNKTIVLTQFCKIWVGGQWLHFCSSYLFLSHTLFLLHLCLIGFTQSLRQSLNKGRPTLFMSLNSGNMDMELINSSQKQ